MNAHTQDGTTALRMAVLRGQTASVEVLLAKGADINARDQDGRTALMAAAVGGQTASVEVLLAKGADINARDQDGRTALMWAEKKGDSLIIQLLKKAGGKNEELCATMLSILGFLGLFTFQEEPFPRIFSYTTRSLDLSSSVLIDTLTSPWLDKRTHNI